MGGVDSWFDDLDEKKVSMDGLRQSAVATGSSYENYKSPRSLTIFAFYIYIFFLSFS